MNNAVPLFPFPGHESPEGEDADVLKHSAVAVVFRHYIMYAATKFMLRPS